MRLLLDAGAEVDARDHKGRTPLLRVLESSQDEDTANCVAYDAARLLLGRGADVNAVDEDGRSTLGYACGLANPDEDTVRALLAAGARVGRDDGPMLIGELLAVAARNNDAPVFRLGIIHDLLDAGAGASFGNVRALTEEAEAWVGAPEAEDAEAVVQLLPRMLAAAERALDEDVAARVAAGLAAAVEADRRDVANGLRSLITGAAAEARRLEAARAAGEPMAREKRAAPAPRSSGGRETKPPAKRAMRGG
jgi:ankyrin repeat protein